MGIHTFNTLVLRNRPPHWLGIVVAAAGWASALIIGLSICTLLHLFILRHLNQPGVAPVSVTSDVNGPFYNMDGLTCDISRSYGVAHMLLFFLPVRLPLPGRSPCPHDPKVVPCVIPLGGRLLPHFFNAPRHHHFQLWPENPF